MARDFAGRVLLVSAVGIGVSSCSSDPLHAQGTSGTVHGGGARGGAGVGGGAELAGGAGGAAAMEVCGNGLDDDHDGVADEGCACEAGTTQPCYGGPAEKAGVGACAYGQQTCAAQSSGEIVSTSWGACEGWIAPASEVCGDDLDSDCDGTKECGAGGVGAGTTSVSTGSGDENTSSSSGDQNTSSGSGDQNTSSSSGGGYVCVCIPGTTRWCDTPVGCKWGLQTCAPDETWGTCIETLLRPVGCEASNWYETACCLASPDACCQALVINPDFDPATDPIQEMTLDLTEGECSAQLDCN